MTVYIGSNELKEAYIWNQKIKEIRVGDKLVFPDRVPDSNIMLYLPLEDDIAEKTWRSSITNYWVTLTTLNWIKCWYLNWSSRIESNLHQYNNINHTLGVWVNLTSWEWWVISANPCWIYNWDTLSVASDSWTTASYISWVSWATWSIKKTWLNFKNSWHHIMFSWGVLYVDWQSVWSGSGSYAWNQIYTIWGHTTNSSCSRAFMKWYIREVLIGKTARTAQEVLKYYNYTKSKLWL